jgi:hypothetical protein
MRPEQLKQAFGYEVEFGYHQDQAYQYTQLSRTNTDEKCAMFDDNVDGRVDELGVVDEEIDVCSDTVRAEFRGKTKTAVRLQKDVSRFISSKADVIRSGNYCEPDTYGDTTSYDLDLVLAANGRFSLYDQTKTYSSAVVFVNVKVLDRFNDGLIDSIKIDASAQENILTRQIPSDKSFHVSMDSNHTKAPKYFKRASLEKMATACHMENDENGFDTSVREQNEEQRALQDE